LAVEASDIYTPSGADGDQGWRGFRNRAMAAIASDWAGRVGG